LVKHPLIYEINTWAWLGELRARSGKWIDLSSVPSVELDAIAAMGFDAVWLMGVWQRSPAGLAIALENEALVESFRIALPDVNDADVVGSPYCIRGYTVDERLGGSEGLAVARRELASRGLGLILDFVPNHVAPDHPWAETHQEYFIRGDDDDIQGDPVSFLRVGTRVYANGRDPNFPPWPDVIQLNAFSPELRAAVVAMLAGIAEQCDGVRCDMAMLMMSDVFERTWGQRGGRRLQDDYWPTVIGATKARREDFVFLAEAYWDLEFALQQQGFDYCYDKRLYDRLRNGGAEGVRAHLSADTSYQRRLVRFIENHDEPRAAATFPPEKARAAAVTALTQTGARLVHEGQLEGRRVRPPVFLARRPYEEPDPTALGFYERLLAGVRDSVFRTGEWQLCEPSGWEGNDGWENLVGWAWRDDQPRKLIVVNLSDSFASGHVAVPWDDVRGESWRLEDSSDGEVYERSGDELHAGLYVGLEPWGWHLFDLKPVRRDVTSHGEP
jgi:glycosidase